MPRYHVRVQVPEDLRDEWLAALMAFGVVRVGDESWSARVMLDAKPDAQGKGKGVLQLLAPEAPDLHWRQKVVLMAGDRVALVCTVTDKVEPENDG